MRYAMHESEAADGRLFDRARVPTSRSESSPGGRGRGRGRRRGALRPRGPRHCPDRRRRARGRAGNGAASSAAARRGSSTARLRAVSVLVHDPDARRSPHAVRRSATLPRRAPPRPGRQFLLGVTPETAAPRSTQFIGLVPPGRAPDHFHTYDEVIYVLDGEGTLFIGGERGRAAARLVRAPARPPRPLPGEHGRDASCACSASSDRPARRPRPITRRHTRRPTGGEPTCRGSSARRHQLGRECRARRGLITAEPGAFSELPFSLPTRIAAVAGKTSPEELLAAAHAGCLTMSLASELTAGGDAADAARCDVHDRDGRGRGAGHQIVGSNVVIVGDGRRRLRRGPRTQRSSSPTRAVRSRSC